MDEDSSGLTFVEWYQAQAVDKSQDPAPMIINASQMRVAGFKLDKVIPPQLRQRLAAVCARGVLVCASFGVWGPNGLC